MRVHAHVRAHWPAPLPTVHPACLPIRSLAHLFIHSSIRTPNRSFIRSFRPPAQALHAAARRLSLHAHDPGDVTPARTRADRGPGMAAGW